MKIPERVLDHAGIQSQPCDTNACESYVPSNGTDGDSFTSQWCAQCRKDTTYRGGQKQCSILNKSLCGDRPSQWVYLEGQPICAAFADWQEPKKSGGAVYRSLEKQGQISLFDLPLQPEPSSLLKRTSNVGRSPPGCNDDVLPDSAVSWYEGIVEHRLTVMSRLVSRRDNYTTEGLRSLTSRLMRERSEAQAVLDRHYAAIAIRDNQHVNED